MAIVIAGAHSRRLIRAAGGAGAAVGKHGVCAGRGPAKRRKTTIDLPDSGRSKRTLPAPANTIRWSCASACEYL